MEKIGLNHGTQHDRGAITAIATEMARWSLEFALAMEPGSAEGASGQARTPSLIFDQLPEADRVEAGEIWLAQQQYENSP